MRCNPLGGGNIQGQAPVLEHGHILKQDPGAARQVLPAGIACKCNATHTHRVAIQYLLGEDVHVSPSHAVAGSSRQQCGVVMGSTEQAAQSMEQQGSAAG
jgi:hypothetical protein